MTFSSRDWRARWYNHFSRKHQRKKKYFFNNLVQTFFLWGKSIERVQNFCCFVEKFQLEGQDKKKYYEEKWKIRIYVSTEATKTIMNFYPKLSQNLFIQNIRWTYFCEELWSFWIKELLHKYVIEWKTQHSLWLHLPTGKQMALRSSHLHNKMRFLLFFK